MEEKKPLRIVFMGTPEFAVPSLAALVQAGHQVVGVVTAPDKPAGRGQKLSQSPVKEYAVSQGLHVLQPEKLKNPEFLEELRSLRADVQVVVAFRMLPEVAWAMPPCGTFNLHASLLPQYRGAAPINWAIINGEKETGCTTFFLQQEIDTGAIIFQEREPIAETDTVGTLYERLMHKGAALVVRTIEAIAAGTSPSQPQVVTPDLKPAPKIFKETCQINWNLPARQVYDFMRGLSPYPAAWAVLNGKNYKIYWAEVEATTALPPLEPGQVHTEKAQAWVGCATGALKLLEIQQEGRKRMTTAEFLVGNKF